ncbi:MAG: M13 family metallopeptidase [Chitinophagaceae bacterium]|nr:M13 family metallopeptidase [Chitinophagaceae bacterium]
MNKKLFPFIIVSAAIISITACKNNDSRPASEKVREHFIETQFFDSSVKPADNFYRFVNGKWLDTVKIPDDQSGVGSFYDLAKTTRERMRLLLEEAAKNNNDTGSIEQKVGGFYISGMDTATINQRGYDPVKPLLAQIDATTDIPALLAFAASEEKAGNETIFGFEVFADLKNSSMNIANLEQTGLGLPDRDYYFKTDSATLAIQEAYKNYLAALFELTGTDAATASKHTEIVYAIEKSLAASHKTQVQMRDIPANYHKLALSTIVKEQPKIGWAAFFNNLGAKVDSVNMGQPAYYVKLNALLQTVPLTDWKLYFKAHTLKSYATVLSRTFQDAAFGYAKTLNGQKVQKPRWETLSIAVDRELGEALGQLYVQKYFPPEAKQRMNALVDNLVIAFSKRIQNLDWMSDSTQAVAQDKLKAFRRKIGYPDKWRDYSKVIIDKSKYFENTVAGRRNNFDFNLSQLGNPVDQSLWYMTPQTVNAYYNPTVNDINFPAAILQFPFFDKDADDAVNYGGIGMVIGHEMTHGFDDQGAQFDKAGNMHDWWTKEDKTRFDKKVLQIQRLYDGFTVLDTMHVNGKLTTGENIADFGGIAIAYDAFKMTPQGQDTARIDGYTPEQRFFMSLAQIWRIKNADEITRVRINTDPHSPPVWRVLAPLMNFAPFYNTFNVQPGDKMYRPREERVHIW